MTRELLESLESQAWVARSRRKKPTQSIDFTFTGGRGIQVIERPEAVYSSM